MKLHHEELFQKSISEIKTDRKKNVKYGYAFTLFFLILAIFNFYVKGIDKVSPTDIFSIMMFALAAAGFKIKVMFQDFYIQLKNENKINDPSKLT